jgi:aspartokinase/homoserine dehydrogenase 1
VKKLTELEVIKLGGSILKDKIAFVHATKIVEKSIANNILPICVVSAMNGVTDRIIKAVEKCKSDTNYDPKKFIQLLYKSHLKTLPEKNTSELDKEFEKLNNVLAYINSSGELTDSVYAYAISRGENFSSRILSLYLNTKGIKNKCFYGEELMVTDENFLEASVNLDKTRYNLE